MNEIFKCPVSEICGGCQLQQFSYNQQLEIKQEKIEKLFSKYDVNKIIGMNNPLHYRNKVQVAFGKDYKNHVLCGNYVSSTHKIVEMDNCQLANKKANDIIKTIKQLVISFKLSIFDEQVLKGLMRHVLIRTANKTGEIMVVLVTGSLIFPKKKDFIRVLLEKHPEITTIIQSVNNRHTSMVLGDKFETLYGKGYIEDVLCDKRFKISANSFYQVNAYQTEVLYNKAIELANINKEDIVFDSYCGIGTIGISLADKAKQVIGVEINKQAIRDAKINAKINNLKNIEFYCDDAGKFMQDMVYKKQNVDVLIMDPARAGADNKFLYAITKLKPKKIVYISCNPITQKDNVNYLVKHDYLIKEIQPVDMFPYTEHVECVVSMQRKDNK